MLLKEFSNIKSLKFFKKIYFISYKSNLNKRFLSNIPKDSKILIILSPNLNLDPSDIKFITYTNIKFWIFDWNIFPKKYYLRWLSHYESFKDLKKKIFFF